MIFFGSTNDDNEDDAPDFGVGIFAWVENLDPPAGVFFVSAVLCLVAVPLLLLFVPLLVLPLVADDADFDDDMCRLIGAALTNEVS
jgi:hypothetical protein